MEQAGYSLGRIMGEAPDNTAYAQGVREPGIGRKVAVGGKAGVFTSAVHTNAAQPPQRGRRSQFG